MWVPTRRNGKAWGVGDGDVACGGHDVVSVSLSISCVCTSLGRCTPGVRPC